jgi:MarR-like DNA-binding transcriptional regulator SgrR of sgrS sRNA
LVIFVLLAAAILPMRAATGAPLPPASGSLDRLALDFAGKLGPALEGRRVPTLRILIQLRQPPGAFSTGQQQLARLTLLVQMVISGGRLHLRARLYDTDVTIWGRLKQRRARLLTHLAVSRRVDAAIRSYLGRPAGKTTLTCTGKWRLLGKHVYWGVALGDVDGDARTELVLLRKDAVEIRRWNKVYQRFDLVATVPFTGPLASVRPRFIMGSVTVGDLDGDRKADILARISERRTAVQISYQGGRFSIRRHFGGYPLAIARLGGKTSVAIGYPLTGRAEYSGRGLGWKPRVRARMLMPMVFHNFKVAPWRTPRSKSGYVYAVVDSGSKLTLRRLPGGRLLQRLNGVGRAFAVGDLDGDGRPEVVTTTVRSFGSSDAISVRRLGKRRSRPRGVGGVELPPSPELPSGDPVSALLQTALVLLTMAPGYRPPRYGGRVTAALHSRPLTLDPVHTRRLGEWQLTALLYDGVMRLPRQGRAAVPHLATKLAPTNRGGRTLLIELRTGVRSHRGRVLTSADVVASLRRLARSRAGWVLGAMKSVRAVGSAKVRVTLHRPAAEFGTVLAAPTALVTPRGQAPGRRYDGTGAFRYLRGSLHGAVQLGAYARHFAGRPYLSDLKLVSYRRTMDEVRAFYLRRSIVSFCGTKLWGRRPGFKSRQMRSSAVTTVALLAGRSGPVTDARVRRAIYLATNKRRLRTLVTVAPTRPAHGPVPPVLLGRRAQRRARRNAPYSTAQARRLLRAAFTNPTVAGRLDASGRLVLSLLVDRSRVRDLDAARKISADLAAVSIRVTITQLSAVRFAKRPSGQYDLALIRFTSPVLRSRYHLAAALAAAGRTAQARSLVRLRQSRLAGRIRRFMQQLPLIPLFHVGVRADVAGSLRYLRRGPWGLLRWEGAQAWRGRQGPVRHAAWDLGRRLPGLWPTVVRG